jgi:cell division protein FtsZ
MYIWKSLKRVGNAVKAFASENATVVVGAVIDPSLEDELRVTVVATGIGNERKPDITLVKNSQKAVERPMRPMMHETHAPRYDERVMQQTVNAEPQPRSEPDYLDIPAFLRKQAD